MSLFNLGRLLGLGRPSARKLARKAAPAVEQLDARLVLTCSTVSGYVYNDANNNGLRDPGEQPVAGARVQLRNSAGVVVGTTFTNSDGFYQFDHDATVDTTPRAAPAQTIPFARGRTTWSRSGSVQKFDPSLGTLIGVEVINSGIIHGSAKVESTDAAPQTITSQVNALLRLQVPGYGNLDATDSSSQTFPALAFDGHTDYSGASGRDLGERNVSASRSVVLTSASALALYTGAGTVSFTETASGGTSLIGSSGGNLQSEITTEGEANVTVIYHYVPNNCLRPGAYTVIETQPGGYLDGEDTAGNHTPIPGSNGTDTIPVTVTTGDSPDNNFGELTPASLSGYVYVDRNNNGVREPGENGIPGTTVRLTGTDDRGVSVALAATTNGQGFYQFGNLRPGQYRLNEVQPPRYLDGLDAIGTQGGTTGNDVLSNIVLQPGVSGAENNFGEIAPAGVSGWVYVDRNNNGRKEAGELGIRGVLVTLQGVDFQGHSVRLTRRTDANGRYSFRMLLPGDYHILETQPTGYVDGLDTPGTGRGRRIGNDHLFVSLGVGELDDSYNFGERLKVKVTNPEGPITHPQPSKGDLLWSSLFGPGA